MSRIIQDKTRQDKTGQDKTRQDKTIHDLYSLPSMKVAKLFADIGQVDAFAIILATRFASLVLVRTSLVDTHSLLIHS